MRRRPRRVCVASSIAGSDASDDCVLNATVCGATAARANFTKGTPAQSTATGYNAIVITMQTTLVTTTNDATAPSTPRPSRAPMGNVSANTPTGATSSTQPTITIMVSTMAWKKPTS